MTLLPSPVPHPLDYAPWDLPGWIHEALDWVVGVEWPEGNERAVWDLADQWYAVAAALAAPRADAIEAAADVQSGYGAVGAVPEAFEAAWRRLAEGDEAPLPVLLAVSTDLGRMVEECGCDIEAAKLEVWIELGILVVELLSLAVAAVLTAGAASPAAGAAIATSRVIVQQIFRRLAGQLARKSLRHGLKEAGERAGRRVAEGGVRGLARRSALGGLAEAGEEAGISLATQAYQNSTGRRDGLDLTDLGTSALGGLAGGAAAPLAGLGRHATGHGAGIGEQVAREMAGEVIAENAAGLATGAGLSSVEDAARAAVSGGTGAATARADAALQARLDGRLTALASMNLGLPPGPGLPGLTEPVLPAPRPPAEEAFATVTPAGAVSTGAAGHPLTASTVPAESGPPVQSSAVAAPPPIPATNTGSPTSSTEPVLPVGPPTVAAQPVTGTIADSLTLSTAGATSPSVLAGPPPPLSGAVEKAAATAGPTTTGGTVPPAITPLAPSTVATAPGPTVATSNGWPAQPAPAAPLPPAPTPAEPAPAAPAPATRVPEPVPPHRSTVPSVDGGGPPPRRPATGGPWVPDQPLPPTPRPPSDGPPDPVGTQGPRPAAWAEDLDAFERRRHRGHFEHQRRTHEENRRRDRATERRRDADRTYDEIRWLISEGRELAQAGLHETAERYFAEARDRERWYHQQWDLAEEILAGTVASPRIGVDEENFQRINDDVGDLATGAVDTSDHSALTGDRHPPPIDRTRRYGRPGGLRPPLALHQTDVERRVPRQPDGRVTRTPDPRQGDWFRLMNDGGPAADPTRGINCVDCTLSLFDTWVHGRPRVSAPRTFDAYAAGDVNRPLDGELDGPRRVEQVSGGRFQRLCEPGDDMPWAQRRHVIDRGYRNLHDQLVLGGHGSYAFVINTWEGGGSHISVALNQNGTVLYLDPQTGAIATRPLYPHTGTPNLYNSINLEVLVLGSDARPMPMAGLARGRQSVLPDLPEYPPAEPDEGYGQPYLNRLHVLAGPGSAAAERAPVTDVIAGASDLDSALRAGVPPPDLATALDAPTLRRLVPHLGDAAARDVAAFFADSRAHAMLDGAWREAPPDEPLLAEALIRQMAERSDLARMVLATPELFDSLTARPLTLHHLASHQQAIDVLGDVLAEISQRGAEAVAAQDVPPPPRPTALTPRQLEVSQRLRARRQESIQAGFDMARCHDDQFRADYLRRLYDDAAAAQLELNAMVMRLAGDRGQPGWRRAPKAHRRVLDKLVEYDNDASRLTDLAAAKLEFRRLDDLYDALHELSRDPDVVVLEIKDRFVRPPASGYRDVLLKLRMSNGHIAELRLHLVALEGVAEWEHALYEIRRDLDAIAGEAGRPLTPTERAVRDGLLRRGQDAYWRALGNDRGEVSEG
ncbi:toxin glutamine deamidase domain-containing protein [Micromonospora sp. NPDC005367]|uniref:toxin glutamine deamidase domain-containing protein n=1 Tax=Micromonospora sp. NPDC005367 TaxID=3155590 RepID=UPI0033AB223D